MPFARAKVGDRYVLEMLHERGWQLGGENSGHIVFLDKHTTGDGIVSALHVLDALAEAGLTLEQAAADMAMYPQILINVAVKERFDFAAHRGVQQGAGRRRARSRRRRPRAAARVGHRAGDTRHGRRQRGIESQALGGNDRRRGAQRPEAASRRIITRGSSYAAFIRRFRALTLFVATV